MLYRAAMEILFGFCVLVSLVAMSGCLFVLYYTLRMTPPALKEQQPMVILGRKVGMGVVVFAAVVTCAGIGSLLF